MVAERLVEAGCRVLMPWGAPIGSARGLNNVYGLRALRAHFPDIPLVVDAGLGVPSHAAAAMELGYDAVLLNTAVAEAGDPVAMARAFALAIEAGRAAFAAEPHGAARHGGAVDAGDRQGCARAMSHDRSVLSRRPDCELGGAAGAGRRAARPAAHQGPARRRAAPPDARGARRLCARTARS